jgi:hypothetical protein
LYAGIPVTAAQTGKPGEKAGNRYCTNEDCAKKHTSTPHTWAEAGKMKCDICNKVKEFGRSPNTASDATSVLSPQDYPALQVVQQGKKFNVVDDKGNVLSSWKDEHLAKQRIHELYQRLHNKVETTTAQQVQPSGESAGIRPPDVQAPPQPTTPSGGTPLTLDNLQNMKTTLMGQPSTPEIEKLKAGVDASMQTMQQTQTNPAQPGQVAPPVVAPVPSPAQTPAPPQVQASLNLIETAAKKGEFLSVEAVELVSPQAARKMREAGMSRVKAEYLLKRVMPYLKNDSEVEFS